MTALGWQGPEGFLSLCYAPAPLQNSTPHTPALSPLPIHRNFCFFSLSQKEMPLPLPHALKRPSCHSRQKNLLLRDWKGIIRTGRFSCVGHVLLHE